MTTRDVPLLITSATSSSERRITPSWTIAQLKAKLEPITGIAASSQRLELRLADSQSHDASSGHSRIIIEADDEDAVQLAERYNLVPYAEIHVTSTDPSGLPPSFTAQSIAAVPKTTMPISTYEALPNTVRAFKEQHHLGRFDPDTAVKAEQKVAEMIADVNQRQIELGRRCHLAHEDLRRGSVKFVGPIDGLPGPKGGLWIGIELDEPTGKSDGSLEIDVIDEAVEDNSEDDDADERSVRDEKAAKPKMKQRQRFFHCREKYGAFVRPDRVIVGDFPPLDVDELEEI